MNKYMSRNCFNKIIASLRYRKMEVQYEDGFFHIRQMEEAWNKSKEVGGVDMLEYATEDSMEFRIFFFKDTDCAMKIMALWMIFDEL